MSKPTPRPWQVDPQSDHAFVTDLYDDVLFSVEHNLANAAHVVKCVNAHDELVGALKRFINLLDEGAEPMELNYAAVEAARMLTKVCP